MRFLLISAFLASSIAAQEKKCRVEGQVISLAGAPLKKAAVRLQSTGPQNQSTTPTNYTASSDNEGKFLFEEVTAGTYILSAQRTGYINQTYGVKSPGSGMTPLKLDGGQVMKDLVFKLVPQGMIFGRVVDDDGDPLPNFTVQTSRWGYVNGKKQMQMMGNSSSQADGTFVIGGLRSGRYYLSADSRNNNFTFGVDRPGSRKPEESYLKTYFPNVLDAASAALVDVAEGAEVRGVEIHVRRGRVYEVRGRIDSGPSGPKYASLMLIPKGGAGSNFLERRQAQVQGKDGEFQFKNVTPGTYVLQSQFAQSETKDPTGEFTKSTPLVARLEVTVADQNIENLIVPLTPGPEIKGVFKTEGADPAPQTTAPKAPPSIQFRITDDPMSPGAAYAQANDDGTFRMQGVTPSVVRVTVYGLPETTYVKAINFGGQDVNGKDLDLTSGSGGSIEVVVSPNGAEVTGTVRDADGKPVPSAIVQICDKSGELAKSANTDQNGAFDVKGLAPGEYKTFAWEDRGDGIITDPDLRKVFASKATVVKLSEKSRENVEPLLITKDAMETEAAKIR
jgi:protocatechuate 3,4-dioxygenase beta subunit